MVLVDLTRRCNLHCPACRYHAPDRGRPSAGDETRTDFPAASFASLCGELGAMGVPEVVLTGDGEPLLHPDLIRMADVAGAGRFRSTLLTNGTLLDEATARGLVASGLDVVQISLWAATREDHARAHPGADPATFDAAVAALASLVWLRAEARAPRPRVRLFQPIDRRNAEGLARLADLAVETGCDELSLSPLRTRRGAHADLALGPEELPGLRENLEAIRRRLDAAGVAHDIDRLLLRYRLGEDAWRRTPCYVGWVQAHVKPDGAVFPCNSCEERMGSIAETAFAAIWNGPAIRAFRRSMMTREGREEAAAKHDCGYCGQIPDNRRIHRVIRWFPGRRRGRTSAGSNGRAASREGTSA
jgi:radical SAM protein with 4Fe4S-binding SPASM domain